MSDLTSPSLTNKKKLDILKGILGTEFPQGSILTSSTVPVICTRRPQVNNQIKI
jgi:hypothetical protein